MTESDKTPDRYGADYVVELESMLCVEMTSEQKYIALLAYQAGWLKAWEIESACER